MTGSQRHHHSLSVQKQRRRSDGSNYRGVTDRLIPTITEENLPERLSHPQAGLGEQGVTKVEDEGEER